MQPDAIVVGNDYVSTSMQTSFSGSSFIKWQAVLTWSLELKNSLE